MPRVWVKMTRVLTTNERVKVGALTPIEEEIARLLAEALVADLETITTGESNGN